jgi:hypothetical protein
MMNLTTILERSGAFQVVAQSANRVSQLANRLAHVVVLLLALIVPAFTCVSQTGTFDPPLKKRIADFGPSPYYPGGNVRSKLTCYFYRTFMVKEYDEGQKGAEWLSILPIDKGAASACVRSHVPGEKVIEEPEWRGYFKGAKGNLVFFNADDGMNGGFPFIVYDAKIGQKIFEDSAYDSSMWSKKAQDSPFNRLRVTSAQDGQVSLRYLRVVEANCDLHTEKISCWEQVRKKLALKSPQMPVCSGYRGIPTRWASAVAYPVEVLLFPQPATKTIAGPIKCWPVD